MLYNGKWDLRSEGLFEVITLFMGLVPRKELHIGDSRSEDQNVSGNDSKMSRFKRIISGTEKVFKNFLLKIEMKI